MTAPEPLPFNLGRQVRAVMRGLPTSCQICGDWPARPICEGCRIDLGALARRCPGCALRLHPGPPEGSPPRTGWHPEADLCLSCSLDEPPWGHVVAAVDYGYPWDRLIARLKFGGDTGLARPLAELLLRHRWLHGELRAGATVVPVPLSPTRLTERGYNQASLIGRHLCQATGARLREDLLIRVRHTDAQSGLTLDQRRRNLRHAFIAMGVTRPGQRLVLLDDVMTSGETLRACTRALLTAGLGPVSVAVVARTPPA